MAGGQGRFLKNLAEFPGVAATVAIGQRTTCRFVQSIPPLPDPLPRGEREIVLRRPVTMARDRGDTRRTQHVGMAELRCEEREHGGETGFVDQKARAHHRGKTGFVDQKVAARFGRVRALVMAQRGRFAVQGSVASGWRVSSSAAPGRRWRWVQTALRRWSRQFARIMNASVSEGSHGHVGVDPLLHPEERPATGPLDMGVGTPIYWGKRGGILSGRGGQDRGFSIRARRSLISSLR